MAWDFRDELVVHLQHHARVEIALVERAMHPRHRDLHDVRRGPLDRHIDRHALGGVAHGVHTAGHVRDVAPPSEERLHVALLDAERLRLEDVAPDLRVTLEVLVDEPLRFLARHLHAPRETEVAHAVDDPEVQHLRDVALLARHRALGDAETRRGGATVDVRPGAERVDERGVLRDVGQHAQLDLRVVGGDQHQVRRSGHERVANPPAQGRADRDVLQVRSPAREPAGRCDRLLEGRVDPPRVGIDEAAQPLGVCGAKLLDLAVFEDLVDYRMSAT